MTPPWGPIALGCLAGLVGGAAYLTLLWRSVAEAAGGGASLARLMTAALVRVLAALTAIALAARLGAGAGPLAAAVAGFLAARLAATAMVRAARVPQRE